MNIFLPTALDGLARKLGAILATQEQIDAISQKISELPPSAQLLLGALLTVPIEAKDSPEAIDKDHLIYSPEKLLVIFTNLDNRYKLTGYEDTRELLKNYTDLKKPVVQEQVTYLLSQTINGDEEPTALALKERLADITSYDFLFSSMSLEDGLFYQKVITLLAAAHSAMMSDYTWKVFLAGRHLWLLLRLDINLLKALAPQIRQYLVVDIRRTLSLDFAGAINANEQLIGIDSAKMDAPISYWLTKVNDLFDDKSDEQVILDKFQKDIDYLANNDYDKSLILRTAVLYVSLVTGYFIHEPGDEESIKKYYDIVVKEQEDVRRQFKEFLADWKIQVEQKKLTEFLAQELNLKKLADYLATFETQDEAWAQLRRMLLTYYSIGSLGDKDVEVITNLDEFLKIHELNYAHRDLIYFNDEDGKFYWNEY